MRTQSGHEDDEQSVADKTVYRTDPAPKRQKSVRWLKGVPNSQERAEWPGEHQTAMRTPSNQDCKEGSQESALRAPSDQQDIEVP